MRLFGDRVFDGSVCWLLRVVESWLEEGGVGGRVEIGRGFGEGRVGQWVSRGRAVKGCAEGERDVRDEGLWLRRVGYIVAVDYTLEELAAGNELGERRADEEIGEPRADDGLGELVSD